MLVQMSLSFIVLNIFACEIKCWSIFGDSNDTANVTETNSMESEGRFISGMGLSNFITYPPPSHDTPPSRCTCSCGAMNYGARIVGGEETEPNAYPWMARLSYMGRFFCAGSLINDRYVLSAAHCVKGYVWFMIKVTFGEHDRCNPKSEPESRYVLRAISRPFSMSNYDDDIALLRLNDRVPINHVISPICLPNRRSSHYAGTKATVAGWGSINEKGSPSCVLRAVKIPIMTNLECVHLTAYSSGMVTENMMCAGYLDGDGDSCQGDSGGPLMVERSDKRLQLVGIVSWGIGCGRADYPGVYTRVSRYLNWIEYNTHDACYCRN